MPKGERLTAEESVKRILEQQKEKIRKIQAQDREKLRKVRARLAKEKGELQMKAAAEIEAAYRSNPAAIDVVKIKSICEKYWPIKKDPKGP
jgi:ribosomal protein L9